jgi:transcriptional regulator with XRE-family HTH domain
MTKKIDATDTFVGERIRTLRNAKGISQTALADTLGVTFQQVQKYERGVNRVSTGRLAVIANVLDAGIMDFYPKNINSGSHKVDDPCHEMALTPRGVRLARLFNDLNGDKQDVVLSVAAALAK